MILGLVGRRGSGKTTVAKILSKYNFIEFSFADALKRVVSIIFGFDYDMLLGDTPEKRELRKTLRDPIWNLTPEQALMYVGTELFRNNFDQNVWIKILEREIRKVQEQGKNIVVVDCRYENEIEFVRNTLKGQILVLYKDWKELIPDEKLHSSENSFQKEVDKEKGDIFIFNKFDEHRDWQNVLENSITQTLKLCL